MGATLDETRVEIAERRTELHATAEQLEARFRRAIDLPAKARENPVRTAALVGGVLFMLVGGPRRVVWTIRRGLRGQSDDDPLATLPRAMRAFVDLAVSGHGADADDARRTLAREIQAWRDDPSSRREARRMAKAVIEGPPGPQRVLWRALEVGAGASAAFAGRYLVRRLLSGDPPRSPTPRGEAAAPASAWTGWARRDPPAR